MFVHRGFIELVVHMAGLAQAGLLVERLVGRLALVTAISPPGWSGCC